MSTPRRLLLRQASLTLLSPLIPLAPALISRRAHAQTSAGPVNRPGGPRRVVLGQSVPLTGAADQIGAAYAAGAKLYVDAFNARKPSPGWSFELRQLDDGYDSTRATANARRLLADGADVLFGFVGTASNDAAAAVARQEGATLFAPWAAGDALHEAAAGAVFHVRPSMADEALRMVRHCATLGQDRLAVLAVDDAMGRAGLAAVSQALAELKMPPLVATATVPPGSDKVEAAAAQVLKGQPQVVIQVALFHTSAAFIRRMRQSGYGGGFMNFSVVGVDPLFTALGKEVGGVVVSQVVPSPRSPTTPLVREYLAAIDGTDQTPSYESLEGFIAAKVFAEAVRRAPRGWDRAALQKTLQGMSDLDVGGWRVNLRPGVRNAGRAIDLVTLTADGRIIR